MRGHDAPRSVTRILRISVRGQDETGAYLIDRDPRYFAPILNYLRHGRLILDAGIAMEGVLLEAEFFGISSLVCLLRTEMERAQRQQQPQRPSRHVYRVFHYDNEEELTQMLASLSDGWRFEQLAPIGSQDNGYFSTSSTEFAVVVSKELPSLEDASAPSMLHEWHPLQSKPLGGRLQMQPYAVPHASGDSTTYASMVDD